MLKYVLLAGAMTFAAPVIAQTAPQTGASSARTGTTGTVAPATPATTTDAAPATPQAMPAAPATTAQTDPAAPQAAAAAPTEQVATGSQVAQVVDSEFPTYDKDSDGKLSQTEFAGWMDALKAKTDPSAKPNTAAAKKWNTAAFAQADTDKSKSVTKEELTGFLSKG
jgi:hypothetical protein